MWKEELIIYFVKGLVLLKVVVTNVASEIKEGMLNEAKWKVTCCNVI